MPPVQMSRRKKYTNQELKQALAEIRKGRTILAISRSYGIPRSTLQFRLKNKVQSETSGPPSILTAEEETKICTWIKEMARKGIHLKQDDVQLSVKQLLNENPRPNPFKDNHPGKKWFRLFLNRHPEIAEKTREAAPNAGENDIRNWFKDVEEYLTEIGHLHVLDDPVRIFNGEEINFQLCPKTQLVLAQNGGKNVHTVPEKENITCMCTFSASGASTPPMVIFPSKGIQKTVVDSVPSSWGIGASDNGRMQSEVFYNYIANVLYPRLIEMQVQFPVIIFLDGHKTHLTFQLTELCKKLKIIFLALYPSSTKIMQDFKPIKNGWQSAICRWRQFNKRPLTKVDVCPVLKDVLDKFAKAETIRNGFKASGIYPWDEDAIDYSKCPGNSPATPRDKPRTVPRETLNRDTQLDYGTFCNIVGQEMLTKIKECHKESHINNPYLERLVEIWRFFNHDSDAYWPVEQFSTETNNAVEIIQFELGNGNEIIIQQ